MTRKKYNLGVTDGRSKCRWVFVENSLLSDGCHFALHVLINSIIRLINITWVNVMYNNMLGILCSQLIF